MTIQFGKNLLDLDFISGICVGLEIFAGEDAAPEDLFAVTLDILIIRFTFVRAK